MATELPWEYFTNNHAVSYCSLDFSMKLSKVTFPDSQIETKLHCGKTKEKIFITDELASHRAELFL